MSYFDSDCCNNPDFEEKFYRCSVCGEFGFDIDEMGDVEAEACLRCHDEIVAEEYKKYKKEKGLK